MLRYLMIELSYKMIKFHNKLFYKWCGIHSYWVEKDGGSDEK